MSTPTRSRGRRAIIAVVVLVAAGMGLWRLVVHFRAVTAFNEARAHLAGNNPAAARPFLERCLTTWPQSAETHFLAAQAARRDGDLPAATRYLDEAARLNWVPEAVTLERALITAQNGDLPRVEPLLVHCVKSEHPESQHILAVLVPLYMAHARWVEAEMLAKKWTELQPEFARAWATHGDILERLLRKNESVESLRTAVRLDPNTPRTKLTLARMLLQAREPADEAARLLESIDTPGPGDPEVRLQLALCREAQGRPDDAAGILDRLLAEHPPTASTLHARGRLEMNRGRHAQALEFLKRAATLDRSDVDLLYTLFLCLQRTGPPAEAQLAENRWKEATADLKRVAELSKMVSASPRNADLRREIGEIFLRNGRDRDGLRWLETALMLDPEHRPTLGVLVEYYQRIGRPDVAANYIRPQR
jgi:tetratricopeptide (TPR) repeat protein